MKAPQIMRVVYTAFAAAVPLTLLAISTGPDQRYTAAPGDAPLACASAGCHTNAKAGGPINPAGGSVSVTFSQSTYTPGTPVAVTVRVTDPTNRVFGFQLSARLESNLAQAQAGRFSTGSGTIILCDNGAPRSANGNCPASAPVEFIEHSTPSSSGTWTFNWTPPATASGPVRFYVAGNAANGNSNSDGGDRIYTSSATLAPASACVETTPVVNSAISAGAFGARADFAPGTWLEIYGSNFSTVTREWAGGDFNGSIAPISLDRVGVKVNGKDAFVRFISPRQINVQAPDNAGTGPMSVIVSNCAAASAPVSLQQLNAAPGMLAPPSFIVGGKQLLVALTADGTNYIGTIPGVPSRPARPGETIIAYGIGFGATTPAVPAGAIANVATQLVDPLVITVGGVQLTPQQIAYAGLAPGFVGLYQFNLVVPNVADGDHAVTIRVGGATVPQTMFLSVKR